jgi:MoaA/NifB/PqqE/SkfB family radical SAM enzyme
MSSSMLGVISRIPLFWAFRKLGWPKLSPENLTLTLSTHCNSRCKTCNIWKKQENELSLAEWERILASLTGTPYWVTVSGGEPFLQKEIVDFCRLVYDYCHPGILNIPTNAILKDIPEKVEQIAGYCKKSQLIINLSLDGIGPSHDEIRGVPGNFEKFERTLKSLLFLRDKLTNLTIGIHTVISVHNIYFLDTIEKYSRVSGVDQYITEIAEQRVELDTIGLSITPKTEDYREAVQRLIHSPRLDNKNRISNISRAFREQYYQMAYHTLVKGQQILPCFAGWASAQIYCDGTVWPCCIRATPLGNLRLVNYNFPSIWLSDKTTEVRKSILAKDCFCPLANAAYTSMLYDLPTLSSILVSILLGTASLRKESSDDG